MSSTVELIYDADCPNVAAARSQLLRAFAQTGLSPRWQEWERSAKTSPDYACAYGSPTVLVNGRDVATSEPGAGSHCRIYRDEQGRVQRAPAVEEISRALTGLGASNWKNLAAAAPAVGFALLPKLTCSACWPAYAGLLSALGLGFC